MSNAYSLLSTGNTFGDWIVTTNALTKENNDFHANSYHKNGGTLYLDDATLGLQVNNQAIFAGAFQVTGAGSSATIQKNLTVQTGQIYFQNTELTLVASGLIQANGPNTGLYVANTSNLAGRLNVTGNTFLGNNLNVVYNTTTSNSITSLDSYVGRTLNVVEKSWTDVLQANTSANTRLLTVTGSAYVNILQANSSVNTSQLTVSNNVTTSNVVATGSVYVTTNINAANIVSTNVTASGNIFSANSFVTSNVTTGNVVATGSVYLGGNVTTSNVVATGSVYVTTNVRASNVVTTNVTASGNIFSANSFVTSNITTSNVVATGSVYVTNNVTTSNVVATGSVYITSNINAANVVSTNVTASGNVITSNVFVTSNVTTSNVVATGSVFVTSNVTTSNVVATGSVWVTSNVQAANVVASRLYVSGPTQLVGTANTTADLGIGGNLNVPNVLFMGNSTSSANIYALTVGQSAGNGGLTVQGNFTIASPTIYQAPSFTLYGGTAITGGNFAYFNVNRLPGINASFRWSETNKEWGVANVDSGSVYRIVTDEYASGSSSSANSMTYPTSFALANANTYLQSYTNTANTGLKSYGDATYFAKTGGTISGTVTISSGGLISTASPIGIASGGTNNNSYTTGQVLQFNGSSFASLANVTAFSATGSSTAIPVITTDTYGRVTALSTASISTTLSIAGTAGSGSVALASQTLKVTSSTNTVTSIVASGNTITIADMPSGVTPTSYGSSTAIPVLAIDTYGRVTSATTAGVSTTITLAAGSGSGSVSGGGTLTINGGTGISTSVSSGTYTINNTGVTSWNTTLGGLTGGGTGAIVVSGTLAVANGGTGVTTSTGTGSVVLSASPTFTGTVSGITASMVGLGSVTNESKATMFTSPTFTGTVSGVTKSMVGLGSVDNTADASKSVSYAATAGSAPASDVYTWAKAATKPSYSASEVGLGNVTNESKATMFSSPTFTGTVSGISKSMVGLGSVDNTADASKSVSYAATAGSATTAGNITAYTINQSVGSSNSPTFTGLTINGAITASGNITAYYSDKRLKNITGRIQNALGKVNSITGVEYTQSKLAEQYGYNNYKPQVGVIAQEIQSILPEAVCLAPFDTDENGNSKSGENYLTVQYEKLVPLLIEAIKELTLEVEALKNK